MVNPIRLGGNNKCVQIDETKLNYNVKSHRGRSSVAPTWAITMVDTSTTPSKGYAEVVPDRSSETMIPIIEKGVRAGTTIHTDEWKAYNPLTASEDFKHKKITHKYNFVDPITGVHTQNVESFNNKIKKDTKAQMGVRSSHRPMFLTFFIFIDTFKEDSLNKIFEILKI
jgi:transposase-like protein